MSADILLVEQTELLIEEGDDVLIEVETVVELLEVAEQGPSGPRGLQGLQGIQGIQGNPGPGVPAGGTAGQLLAKSSDTDFDDEWIDAPESLPAGGTTGQILTKQSNTDGDAAWEDPAVTGATAAEKADLMAFAAAYG